MEIIPLDSGCSSYSIPKSSNNQSHVKQVAKITSLVALVIILGALTCLGLFALGCPLVAAIPLGGCVAGIGLIALLVFSLKKLKPQQPVSNARVSYEEIAKSSSQSSSETKKSSSSDSDSEKELPLTSCPFPCSSIPLASRCELKEEGIASRLCSFNPYGFCGSAMSWRERCCQVQSKMSSSSSDSSSAEFVSCEETFTTCPEALASSCSCSSEASFVTATSGSFTTADESPMCDCVDGLVSQEMSLEWDNEFCSLGSLTSCSSFQSCSLGIPSCSTSCSSRLSPICEESDEVFGDCIDGLGLETSPMARQCLEKPEDYYRLCCPITVSSIASSRLSRASSRRSRRSRR